MTKVVGPCFSLHAVGNLGKALTYGHNKAGGWVRRCLVKGRRTSPLQKIQRDLFASWVEAWEDLNYMEQYAWERFSKDTPRAARCLFSKYYLKARGVAWPNYPWVPKKCFVDLWNVEGIGWQVFGTRFYWYYKPWFIVFSYQRPRRNLWCGSHFYNSNVANPTPAQLIDLGYTVATSNNMEIPAGLGQYYWMKLVTIDGFEGSTKSVNDWPEINLHIA